MCLDQEEKEVAAVLRLYYNTFSSGKRPLQCTVKANKSKQTKKSFQKHQHFSFYLPATAQGRRKSCGELLTQSRVVHLELNKKKGTKAVIATGWKPGSWLITFSVFTADDNLLSQVPPGGSQKHRGGYEHRNQGRSQPLLRTSPAPPGAFGNLSRNEGKAEAINLEEAAACQPLANNRVHVWKEVKPAACVLERMSKPLSKFPWYFCHSWGKPTLVLGVCVTLSPIILVRTDWLTTG